MTDYEAMVREFHEKHGHTRSGRLYLAPAEVALMRLRLVVEEVGELAQAVHAGVVARAIEATTEHRAAALVAVADALADLLYVVFGTAIAYGIPIARVFDEVHRSNMSKGALDECSKGGKTAATFRPPDLRRALGLGPAAPSSGDDLGRPDGGRDASPGAPKVAP